MKYAVGIDVGGTNTRVALINEKYEIKERVQFGSDPKNPIKTLNQINDVIKGFGEKIEGIGISCPGPLDLINGIILTPPNLPGWHNFELTKELHDFFRETCGGTCCRILTKGKEKNSPERKEQCTKFVAATVKKTAEIILREL